MDANKIENEIFRQNDDVVANPGAKQDSKHGDDKNINADTLATESANKIGNFSAAGNKDGNNGNSKMPSSNGKTNATKSPPVSGAKSATPDGGGGGSIANAKAHPTTTRGTSKSYIQLVHEAIATLKDRTGSSQIAIQKYLGSTYPNLVSTAQPNRFKQHVLQALKSGVKASRFQKIKASYKINMEWKKKEAAAKKRKRQQELKKKKEKELAKKKEQEQQKQQLEKKSTLQAKIDTLSESATNLSERDSGELQKLIAEKKRKEEAEARKKQIAERLRRRRFPMEDTRLHMEDKELGIKPPKDVGPRPILPVFFALTQNDGRKSNKLHAVAASRCDGLNSSRGLVTDLLQVYHFFRGDLHYVGTGACTADREIIPQFSLKHLVHAVDDVLSGTTKRARMVPPLIVHLFVTCLQMLTAPPDSGGVIEDDSRQRRQLQSDFATHLNTALSPTSWSDVCHLYMDAIDRHYTTEASAGKNVLQGLSIDADYLLGVTDEEAEMPYTELPAGYTGYLGDPEGTLARAHIKLERHDPWLLTAEELMGLLRALTDDVLARKPEISEDLSNREEQMYELLKAKRAADAKFRKVRLAYEGPKEPRRKRPVLTTNTEDKASKEGQIKEENSAEEANRKSLDSNGGGEGRDKADKEWKPTATKKQFESARKAQQKASDAYEKGVRKLMARTEPVGWDRNHDAVYCFRHDPEVLYLELLKPAPIAYVTAPEDMQTKKSTWHVIETKSLFDQFVHCLDLRGKRENALYEELMGPQGVQQSLRRFLYDDIKERLNVASQMKEKEDLKRRLENAKLKCDEEEGRRSGRLASRAEEELGQIEADIAQLEQKINTGAIIKELDYEEFTGLELLRKYDDIGKAETRRTREKMVAATVNKFESLHCSKLRSTGNIDDTGFVGMLVANMLEVEESCESLVPWDRKDITRQKWIADLENLVLAWNAASPFQVGPADAASQSSLEVTSTPSSAFSEVSRGSSKKRPSTGDAASDSKKMKADNESAGPSSLSVSQAVAKLRQPLLELEKRVFTMTGLAMAAKDSQDADDSMSTSEEEESAEKESKERRAWKKVVNKLNNVPSKRHVVIREMVVEAISAARKAQLKVVVGQLRSALLEFHPNAAGACKTSALKVLESHGGYDHEDEDDDDDDVEEEDANDDAADADADPEAPSALCAEAVIVNSSLDGIEDSGHHDWVDAVKSGKTLSRMACLVTAFVKRAKKKLEKIREERDALAAAVVIWEKEEERRLRNQAKSNGNAKAINKGSSYVVSEVWADVNFTDEIVMTKVEPYPWWPAKRCMARDGDLAASLNAVNRCLVSLVGESGGLRVVETSAVRSFTGKLVEEEEGVDVSNVSKETKTQLDECMTMARRILRSHSTKKKKGVNRGKAED